MQVKKAVFPVAGLGTRFLPATKSSPKEMLPLIDKPLVQYVVEEAVAAGIEQILFVTGRGKRALEDYFDISFELEALLQEKGKEPDRRRHEHPDEGQRIRDAERRRHRGDGQHLLRSPETGTGAGARHSLRQGIHR